MIEIYFSMVDCDRMVFFRGPSRRIQDHRVDLFYLDDLGFGYDLDEVRMSLRFGPMWLDESITI